VTAGAVIVGADGVQSTRDATALGRLLADVLDAPLDLVTSAEHPPARGLARAAAGDAASVVVIGPTHRRSAGRVLAGTARQFLHRAHCALAVAPAGFADRPEQPLRHVGVGYEPTPEGHAALLAAHDLAARAGAELRVIGIVLPLAPIAIDELRDWGAYYDEEREIVEGGLTEALEALPGDVPATIDARVGSPAAELAAASEDLDLLVCGSRGRGPTKALLLGSVTERLLRDAACPLLIVPRPA
jgi:nucleotide-binding universal stress UspA family protein